eukprot:scaffold13_cov241-Pinguiococcus_pyrenoidosus.AAC.1
MLAGAAVEANVLTLLVVILLLGTVLEKVGPQAAIAALFLQLFHVKPGISQEFPTTILVRELGLAGTLTGESLRLPSLLRFVLTALGLDFPADFLFLLPPPSFSSSLRLGQLLGRLLRRWCWGCGIHGAELSRFLVRDVLSLKSRYRNLLKGEESFHQDRQFLIWVSISAEVLREALSFFGRQRSARYMRVEWRHSLGSWISIKFVILLSTAESVQSACRRAAKSHACRTSCAAAQALL